MTDNERLRGYDRDRNKRLLQAAMGLFAVFLAISFSIWYTAYTNEQNDQRWCDMIVGLDDNYRSADKSQLPERTRRFAKQVHTLRRELGCPETNPPPPPRSSQVPSPTGS